MIQSGYGSNVGEKAAFYSNRGDGYLDEGEVNLAIEDYQAALNMWPTYFYYWVKIGLALDRADRRAEAVDSFSRALVFHPTSVEALVNRGVDYDRGGKHDLALNDFDRAISLDDSIPEAFNDRGYTLVQMGRVDEAIQNYNRALKLDGRYVAALNNRAWAFHLKGQDKMGVMDAETAFILAPGLVDSSRIRATLYEALGRRLDAIKAYRVALKLDPRNEDSKEGLRRLSDAR
jgi:tetratricopeptide (TPR) repeat protein